MSKKSKAWRTIKNKRDVKVAERKANSENNREGHSFGYEKARNFRGEHGNYSICGYLRNFRVDNPDKPTEIRGLCYFVELVLNRTGVPGFCSKSLPMPCECKIWAAYFEKMLTERKDQSTD